MRKLPKVIQPEDWDKLAAQPSRRAPTGKRNLAVMHAMRYAGLRVSEVADLSARDLNAKSMTLRVRDGKGGRDRSNLGVPASTWAVFERWAAVRPDSRYFFSTLGGKRVSERYLTRDGHALRHARPRDEAHESLRRGWAHPCSPSRSRKVWRSMCG